MPRLSLLLAAGVCAQALPALAQSCEDRISDYERRVEICAAAAASAATAEDASIALGYKGEAERMLGRYDAAADSLRQAIALSPSSSWSWIELGTVALDSGDPVDAIARYSIALELQPGDSYALGNRADAWRILNAPGRCAADADRALVAAPDDLFARLVNGRCLTDLGRADAALGQIDQVLAAAPDWIEAYLAKMTALMALGRHEESLAIADQALDPAISGNADPGLIEDLKALRLAAQARLLPADALLAEADALAASYPDNPMILNVRLWTLIHANRHAEAETAAAPLRALIGTPDMEGIYHDTLAQLDLAAGRTDAAIAGFAEAMRLDPSLARIYAKSLSQAGFLPLSAQAQNVTNALRRCIDAKGKDCPIGT